ncbi:MAG TPA: hypothetical protein VGC55_12705 [Dokdonella sp.]
MTRSLQSLCRFAACALIAAANLAHLQPAHADGFSAVVSPPRFESTAKAGETYRDVIEISNVSSQPSSLTVKTADWHLDASAAAVFTDDLAPDSCRPWVAVERHELTLGASGKYRFRFEAAVPAGTPDRECRFALMFEGASQQIDAQGLKLPVSGRIGVIVYLAIGNVASDLQLTGYGSQNVNGERRPSLHIANRGSAHGRLDGFVEGTDADGASWTLVPSTLPILPGEERDVALSFDEGKNGKKKSEPRYPLKLHGTIYDGHRAIAVDTSFTP